MNKFKMLKKCLLGLFVLFVGLLSFSNAGSYTYTGVVNFGGSSTNNRTILSIPTPYVSDSINSTFNVSCTISNLYNQNSSVLFDFYAYGITSSFSQSSYVPLSRVSLSDTTYNFTVNQNQFLYVGYVAIRLNGTYANSISFDWSCTLSGTNIIDKASCGECPVCPECPECQECPEVDTGSILSGSCDTNYCLENDLCPSLTGSWSELKINNIVHEGKPFINISIPDYIFWDYSIDTNQFDLYVGSGYDQDYIDSVLKINSYRPDNEDFTNIFVSGLTLIFPYIFVALLIVFIWKLLKRIFK